MTISQPENVSEYLNYSASLLKENNIDDARLNAELMLCSILNCDRMQLYMNHDKPLSGKEKGELDSFIRRRLLNEPLQYILGKSHFYGLEFFVNEKVLIPRPETELLVENLIKDITESKRKRVSIFEIGAGTGCISISIAKELNDMQIDFEIFSIDKSAGAIEISESNKSINLSEDAGVRFYRKDVFEIERLTKEYDYIAANPPYVSMDEYNTLASEVRCFEPKDSLTDSGDGFSFFERIFLIASDAKFKGKVFCEIGFGQRNGLEKLLERYGLNQYEFFKDYNSIDRILKVCK